MMQENENQSKEPTLMEKAARLQMVALYPALIVMLFCRAKIGYRVVKPVALYVIAAIMIGGSMFLPLGNKTGVVVYAIAMVAMGLYHRHARWFGICRGEKRHTLCTGDSYLELIKLPAFFQRERRIYRFLDPLLVFAVAALTWVLGIRGLTLYLLISGAALMLWEQGHYERMLNRILDLYDGALDAEVQQMIMRNRGRQPQQVKEAIKSLATPPVSGWTSMNALKPWPKSNGKKL